MKLIPCVFYTSKSLNHSNRSLKQSFLHKHIAFVYPKDRCLTLGAGKILNIPSSVFTIVDGIFETSSLYIRFFVIMLSTHVLSLFLNNGNEFLKRYRFEQFNMEYS